MSGRDLGGGAPLDEIGKDPTNSGGNPNELGRETDLGGTGGTGTGMRTDVFDDMTMIPDEVREDLNDIKAEQQRNQAIQDAHGGITGVDVHASMEAQREAERAERERIEQERIEQMEAAHAEGEPYLWETTTIDGVDVEVWILADGSVAHYDRETDTVVAFQWPEGEGPVYQGDMVYDGEAYAVYELPDGSQVLVDEDGNAVADLDDIDPDTTWHPGFETEVYYVPQGPPTYDTLVYDAETDEILVKVNTGSETLGILEGYHGTEASEIFYAYQPPGADYYLVLDEDGMVVDQVELPPQEVWSVLGIVTYYDDGGVVVDIGVASLEVDVIGPEGGIVLEVGNMEDLFEEADWLGGIEAGLEYDEDGVAIWAEADISELGELGAGVIVGDDGVMFWVEGDIQIPLDGIPMGMEFDGKLGITEDGQLFMGVEAGLEFQIPGGPSIDLDANGYVEAGPQGFEITGGWDGGVGWGPLSLTGGQQGSFVVNEDGMLMTYSEYRGIAVDGLGEVRMGYEAQLEHNEDGTTARGGVFGQTVDDDGDVTGTEGHYFEADGEGVTSDWRQERLDTGVTEETYDKDHDDEDDTSGMPADLDGGSLFERPEDDGGYEVSVDAEIGLPNRVGVERLPDDVAPGPDRFGRRSDGDDDGVDLSTDAEIGRPDRGGVDGLPDDVATGPGRLKLRRERDEGGDDARPAIDRDDIPRSVRDLAEHRSVPTVDDDAPELPRPHLDVADGGRGARLDVETGPDVAADNIIFTAADAGVVDAITTEATLDQAPGGIERPGTRDTTEATPDQAPGGIDRPDTRDTTEATPDHAPSGIERPAAADVAPETAASELLDDIVAPVERVAAVETAIPAVAEPVDEPAPAVATEVVADVAAPVQAADPVADVAAPVQAADPVAEAIAPVDVIEPVADVVGDGGDAGLDLADDGADDSLG